jgi:hypothetical protein
MSAASSREHERPNFPFRHLRRALGSILAWGKSLNVIRLPVVEGEPARVV